MPRYAVIADDFTGASDSGVHFAAAGLRTALVLDEYGIGPALAGHDAIALSTESRFLPPTDAGERVEGTVRLCRSAGADCFYKKIDSTLRGNLAAEIPAALRATGLAAAVICPAMPKTGRTLVGGMLLVNGVPVAETELGCDPFNPVPSSFIRDLVPGLRCGEMDAAATERIEALLADGCELIVANARTDEDLAVLGQAVRSDSLRDRVLPVGAGGFAEAFVGGAAHRTEETPSGRLLAVVGSLTDTCAAQVAHALDQGMFAAVEVNMERAFADPDGEVARLAAIAAAVPAEKNILLKNEQPPARDIGREDGLKSAKLFGQAARAIAAAAGCPRLYVTGGSTAVAVAEALGLASVTLVKECMPGVVLASCAPAASPVRWFITKAGGFGQPDTLARLAIAFLQKT